MNVKMAQYKLLNLDKIEKVFKEIERQGPVKE